MISYEIYKIIHITGILMVFTGLGASFLAAGLGQGKKHPMRKMVAACHGAGLLLVLVAGFGMLARLSIPWPFPGWVFAKMVIWVTLGGLTVVALKKPKAATLLWWLAIGLGVCAAFLAIEKPF